MKKQLDTDGVLNELKQGSRFFGATAPAEPAQVEATGGDPPSPPDRDRTNEELVDPATSRSTGVTTPRTTEQLTEPATATPLDRSTILGRPKAFYITAQQDSDLDVAVTKLGVRSANKVGQKIDRSTVIRLLLDTTNLTSDHTIERLYQQLVDRLIRQLTG